MFQSLIILSSKFLPTNLIQPVFTWVIQHSTQNKSYLISIKGIPHGHARQNQLSDYALPWLEPLEEYYEVFFEVKTRIQSVGALLRQINFYKSYKPGKYVVVSPDDRYKDLLASQDVGFVKAFAL